jgi:PAS domain S-box-containing protein
VNDSASTSAATSSRSLPPDFCAVVALDASGRVTGVNSSAHALWQASEPELLGEAFAALFAFEIVSHDPDFLEAQWEVLLASALDRDTSLSAQPREGPSREVRVRLEKASGGHYLATVRGPAAPTTAAVSRSTDDETTAGLRVLAERGAAGFFDLNLKTGRVQFSPAWKRLLGYTPAELPDALDTWQQLIHPDDSAASPDRLAKKMATRSGVAASRPFSVEFRMKHQRGHWTWIQCVGVQVIDAAGELERVVGLHLDVSERKELEDALVANDARLQDLSGNGPLGAFELDFANDVFWFSPAFESLLGFAEGELTAAAASFAAALPPEEAAAGVEAWLLARSPGAPTFVERVKLRARDGKPVPVLLGVQRTITRKRELTRAVGFACALPAGATQEDGALPSAVSAEAFGALAEAVIIADARGKIIFLNPPAARLLQLAPEAVRGQPLGDVFRLVNRQSGRPGDDPVDRALSADSPLPLIGNDALALSEGPPLPIVWTARAVFGPDGKGQAVVIVFRNPDEMTLTPEELVKANRFESLGLLAGGIAHDFNNLLTTILGAVSLAKDNRDYSALGDAEKACMTAKGLTKQLLTFAKGGSGTQGVYSAKDILDDSLKIAAAGSTAAIALTVPDGTEPVMVDRAQILQVFQNLIVNALQAMPPAPHQARLQIHARNTPLADGQVPGLAAGDYVEFEVRDNGSGIKPEHVEKIFDPFFTTKKHGTGLGLATVLSIVRKHGGQIALDTQVGVGTAFTVYLPKATKPIEVQARRAPSLRFGDGMPRVLFMDDDPKISALTATMLQSLEYKYDLAKTGEEAIKLYRTSVNVGKPYAVVIMDLTVVGGMGGEECFVELKKLDPEVRAIVASGYDNEDMARQFLDKGFCGYLTKPYRVTDLGKVLKTVLG